MKKPTKIRLFCNHSSIADKMATKLHIDDGKGNSYNLMLVDGITFPEYFAEDPVDRLREIGEMAGRDDDVIIVAYPKAGIVFDQIKEPVFICYNVSFPC